MQHGGGGGGTPSPGTPNPNGPQQQQGGPGTMTEEKLILLAIDILATHGSQAIPVGKMGCEAYGTLVARARTGAAAAIESIEMGDELVGQGGSIVMASVCQCIAAIEFPAPAAGQIPSLTCSCVFFSFLCVPVAAAMLAFCFLRCLACGAETGHRTQSGKQEEKTAAEQSAAKERLGRKQAGSGKSTTMLSPPALRDSKTDSLSVQATERAKAGAREKARGVHMLDA